MRKLRQAFCPEQRSQILRQLRIGSYIFFSLACRPEGTWSVACRLVLYDLQSTSISAWKCGLKLLYAGQLPRKRVQRQLFFASYGKSDNDAAEDESWSGPPRDPPPPDGPRLYCILATLTSRSRCTRRHRRSRIRNMLSPSVH